MLVPTTDPNIILRYIHTFSEDVIIKTSTYDCSFTLTTEREFNKQVFNWLIKRTNRSLNQTKYLFNILNNWEYLLELEEAIKEFQCFYCPDSYAECMYLIAKLRTWKACNWI